MRLCLIVVLGCASVAPAFAQNASPLPDSPRLIISARAIEMGIAASPASPAPPAQSRDSIANGTLIGAAIGAVAMGAFAGWLCHMLQEPGEPTCWRSVGIGGLYGAGIGAAAGAGIDALFIDKPRIIVRKKFILK